MTRAAARGAGDASFVRGRTGRIIEVRISHLTDVVEVEKLELELAAAVGHAERGAVICADCRNGRPLSPQIAKAVSRAMNRTNQIVTRSALLLDPSNELFNLQMQRIVRCSFNPERRVFRNVKELQSWIGTDLAPFENEALAAFLGG